MLKLGAKVKYMGEKCEVMGVRISQWGKGVPLYELCLSRQRTTYVRKLKELVTIDRSYIAHIPDEELRKTARNMGIKYGESAPQDSVSEKDVLAISAAPLVGFVNVPEEDLELAS